MGILNSLIGMVTLIAIAVALSKHRKAINKRTVGVAFLIQFMIGAIVLYVPVGRDILNALSDGVSKVLSYGNPRCFFCVWRLG